MRMRTNRLPRRAGSEKCPRGPRPRPKQSQYLNSLSQEELVHRSVPDRPDTNYSMLLINVVEDPIHVAPRAEEKMAYAASRKSFLGRQRATQRKALKRKNGVFELI